MTDSKTKKAEGEMGSSTDDNFAWTEPEAPPPAPASRPASGCPSSRQ